MHLALIQELSERQEVLQIVLSLLLGLLLVIVGNSAPVGMLLQAVVRAPLVNVVPHTWDGLAELNADVVVPLLLELIFIRIYDIVDLSGNLLRLLDSLLELLLVVSHVERVESKVLTIEILGQSITKEKSSQV